ncbi:hypothetical protein [Flavobacterium beibuense]|uniref:hypothetical protein n=1 Tax=Flavobacterium beibuense TaxID=657326 RepID=UPI003A9033D3
MAVRENTIRLHQQIKNEFTKLSNKTAHGVQVYSLNYILHEVAHRYCKSPKTVENIVFNRTVTANYVPTQSEMFNPE